MSPLPDRPDLDQLRTQAKELKRAAEAGDRAALDRILAHHPKFTGRPPERLEGWQVSLRDAQVTLARELGFDGWRQLVAQVEKDDVARWDVGSEQIQARAFKEARKHQQRFCTGEHFLLALLAPSQPTAASQTLTEVGLSYDRVAQRVTAMGREADGEGGIISTPAYHLIVGSARGIALGLGATGCTDEHVLLAMLYGDPLRDSLLADFDVDPDEVIASLRARRVQVPQAAPPVTSTISGPGGPWVYFPEDDFRAATQEILKHYPPGTARWGTNRSKWKPNHWYVHGEDEIPMERIVKAAVADPTTIEVLTHQQGFDRESADRPTLEDND